MTGSLRAFDVIISSTFRFVIPQALATALSPSLVADGSSTTLLIFGSLALEAPEWPSQEPSNTKTILFE